MMLNALLPPSESNTFLGPEVTESLFITALVWSVGGGLLEDGQVKFDNYVKRLSALSSNPADGITVGPGEVPSGQPTLYEYYFDIEKSKWVPWLNIVPEYVHNPESKFSEILVPTIDTVRGKWLVDLMVNINRPVVLVGETGTSKTATIQNFLRELDNEKYVSDMFMITLLCLLELYSSI